MHKAFTLTLAMLLGGALSASAQTRVSKDLATRFTRQARECPISVPGMHRHSAASQQFEAAGLPQVRKSPARVEAVAASEITTPGFGYITGPDGTQWYYTQSMQTATVGYSTYYTQAHIVIYDSDNQQQGEATIDIPAESCVNYIEVFGDVTTKLFDRDEKTKEFMVALHYTTADYTGGYLTYVYNMEGERVREFEGSGLLFDASEGWNTYQRFLLPRTVNTDDGREYTDIDIIAPPAYGETEMQVEHTFRVDFDLYNYSPGSFLNCYVADGKPYYVLSYYEKPYVTGYDPDTYDMIVNSDNSYIVATYDKSFNLVDSISVPLDTPNDALYRFGSFGMMSDFDLSDGYFTDKGKRAYIIGYCDYITAYDEDIYDFVVFDQEGNKLKTICEDAYDYQWFELSPVKGQSDQWAFLQIAGSSEQMQMVELPSCELATTMPYDIEGNTITSTLDRYPVGDSYQYLVKLSTADTDSEGNAIARIAWYNPDLTLDHISRFNLGPNGEYFTPLLNSQTLNPYVFDTDDDLEFLYIAKKKRTDSDVVDNVLEVADENGNIEWSWNGGDDWAIRSPALLDMTESKQQLLIAYYGDENEEYKLTFYDLPLTAPFKSGDGTKANPYLIQTPGDMLQISKQPAAAYKLANDIDMAKYPGNWTPVSDFAGSLDGDGHSLSNLYINTTKARAGLFANMAADATVKNLVVVKPQVFANSSNSYVGVIAGDAIRDTLSNVHVFDASITLADGEETDATVGGLVASASYYSLADACSFEGVINQSGADICGGIFGETNTTTLTNACAAKGTFTAAQSLGGIVGSAYRGCDITNCHSNVDLKATQTIGGIVGDNGARSAVKNCIAEGTIASEGTPKWGGRALGGIVGSLESDWTKSSDIVVSGNVSGVSISYPATAEGEEADATIHRIAGKTINNEEWGENETPRTEEGMSDNYALSTVLVGGAAVSSTDATSVEGATAELASLTREALEKVGFAYYASDGDTSKPWQEATSIPVLYFEQTALALLLDQSHLTMEVGDEKDITATVYGTDASALQVTVDGSGTIEATITATDGNTATIHLVCKASGSAEVSVSAGTGMAATCTVTCWPTAIENATATDNALRISLSEGMVSAPGATGISLFNAAGQLVATSNGSAVSTLRLAPGVYVVTATNAAGRTTSAKLAVK